jgi:hypothetical protein
MLGAVLQTGFALEQFSSHGATAHVQEPGFRRQETEGQKKRMTGLTGSTGLNKDSPEKSSSSFPARSRLFGKSCQLFSPFRVADLGAFIKVGTQ